MTTPAAAALYLAQHLHAHEGRRIVVYNPNALPLDALPTIYAFNNGGSPGWMSGCLMAEDGTALGGHCCSDEGYMPADLGVLEGTRDDRHEGFRAHYPGGYRMEFVRGADVLAHEGLMTAYALNQKSSTDSVRP